MQNDNSNPIDEAIDWHVRLAGASGPEWLAFTEWLERPESRTAYDRVAMADAALGDALQTTSEPPRARHVETPRYSSAASPHRPSRALAAASAIALAFASLTLGYPNLFPQSDSVAFESAAGQQRTLALADGSRIMLNGASRVILDRNRPRVARLERGEAAFQVVHDPANPFTLSIGDARVQDVGTLFNVAMRHNGFDLAVAEGAVVFNPDAEKIKLVRGATLHVPSGDAAITVGSADPHAIGAWRRGELIYHDAPLRDVVADLERSLGTAVSVDRRLGSRPFTGVIRIDHSQEAFFKRLDGLFGTRSRRSANGWQIEPA